MRRRWARDDGGRPGSRRRFGHLSGNDRDYGLRRQVRRPRRTRGFSRTVFPFLLDHLVERRGEPPRLERVMEKESARATVVRDDEGRLPRLLEQRRVNCRLRRSEVYGGRASGVPADAFESRVVGVASDELGDSRGDHRRGGQFGRSLTQRLDQDEFRAGVRTVALLAKQQSEQVAAGALCEHAETGQHVLRGEDLPTPALIALERRQNVVRVAQRLPMNGSADGGHPTPNAVTCRGPTTQHSASLPAGRASLLPLPDGNRRDRIVQSGGRAFIHGPPRGARRTFWPRLGLTVGTVGIRPSLDALGARRAFYGSTRRSSTPPSPGHAPESRPALAGHARPHRAPAAARRANERLRPEPPEPGPSRATC